MQLLKYFEPFGTINTTNQFQVGYNIVWLASKLHNLQPAQGKGGGRVLWLLSKWESPISYSDYNW